MATTGVWIGCHAPYGSGGFGVHLAELVEDAREAGRLGGYFCGRIKPGDKGLGTEIRNMVPGWVMYRTPVRFSPGWRGFLNGEGIDRSIAAAMKHAPDAYVGFVGQALRSFHRARQLGATQLELVSATSHVRNVQRQHRKATERYGIEPSWLNEAQLRKTLKEYEAADVIQVNSDYTRESLLRYGLSEEKLRKAPLRAHPRYRPPQGRPDDGIFRIVYVGRLNVTKGIPVLLNAFAKMPVRDAELTLVGAWATRGMRRYLQAAIVRDPRIRIAPGDPLPHFHRADVCVHPSFEDGFGYAPAEALACGVPAIVTEDTGMKELVREGENGYVVPTGDTDAVVDRVLQIRDRPLAVCQ